VEGLTLPVGDRLTLGRVQGDLVVADPKLSRRHVSIVRQGRLPVFTLQDHGSKNGTLLEGRRVQSGPLGSGAIIRLGDTLVAFGPLAAGDALAQGAWVGSSPASRRVLGELDRVAPTAVSVLVLGETGSGKELAARRLHAQSGRSGAFVAVNCGAIPGTLAESTFFGHTRGAFTGATHAATGRFEAARGGTLFLDEVGELPLSLQPKLLRALETGEVVPVGGQQPRPTDARVVAATNAQLDAAMAEGRFRPDLYARLAGYVVRLPALRERREDIPELARHLLAQATEGPAPRLSADLLERLLLHPWPMNVRELRTVMQRLALLSAGRSSLDADVLPSELLCPPPQPTLSDPLLSARSGRQQAPDAATLSGLLTRHRGAISRVAQALGTNRKQVYRWMAKHGLDADAFRD